MTKIFQAGKLSIRVYGSRAEMGQEAARAVAERIVELQRWQPEINIIFAAAPSQEELLQGLRQAAVDWSRVNAFHMDEYTGLGPEAPQCFGVFLRDRLFGRLPFKNIFYIRGDAPDAAAECARYAQLLEAYPPDIVCMGIGENGHIAFNDPPVADFNDPVKVKTVLLGLASRQQQVNDGCFPALKDVPAEAITLTIPALIAAPFICCTVPGPTKVIALRNTLLNPIIPWYPSTILRLHSNAVLFTDDRAAAGITEDDLIQLAKN